MFASIRATIKERGEWRLGRWGSFWHRFAIARWSWAIALCKFEDHWAMHLFCFWINLWETKTPPRDMLDRWGFSYEREFSAIHLNWGHRCKIIHMPWSYSHHRMEVMLRDGRFVSWEEFPRRKRGQPIEPNPEPVDRYREIFPYRYVLRSGEVQERQATVTVERREWCWRAWPFSWLRWPRKVKTSIDVEFSDEVGEETGSWKGGTVGCGWDLRSDETPEQCLRRMERERLFE